MRPRLLLGLGGLAVLAVAGLASWKALGSGIHVDAVEPARLRVGQRAKLTGRGFASDPAANVVLFETRAAKVIASTPSSLEVEVPEVVSEAGSERRLEVVVRRGRRSSRPVAVMVLQGPRVHALSPAAALPGEEVLLAGGGLGLGAAVRFGEAPAQVSHADANQVRVVVPAIPGWPGTSVPVVVTVGGVESNSVPFVLGHLPIVTGTSVSSASPGDLVQIRGVGFHPEPLQNDVRVGGQPALVVTAGEGTLDVVVPFVDAGDEPRAIEVRVPGHADTATAALSVASAAAAVEPRFVAEPFVAVPGRPHAVVATGIGPAFVLAASGGRSAAQRAFEAQGRLNDAIPVLRRTLGLTLEARALETSPVIGLAGRPEVLLEVTPEDVAAHGEDWTGQRGRGGPVTRGRLARWWEAVGRDLLLLLVRGERPRFAAALAPEGRVLQQLFDASQKSGQAGVPRQVVQQARPALREGLRTIGLRVPAAVKEPVAAAAATAAATPGPRLALEGTVFRGSEVEAGERRYLTVAFDRAEGGTIAYEGGLTLTMPFLSLEKQGDDGVRFAVRIRGGVRYYLGTWDGEKLAGPVALDREGAEVVASFELRR